PAGFSQTARELDKFRGTQLQDFGAKDPAQDGPVGEGDADDHSLFAAAQHEGDQDQRDEVRHAQKEIDEPGDDPIRRLPHRGRRKAQQQGNQRAGGRRRQADHDAQGQAFDRADKHIPAEPVGAEGVLQGRGAVVLLKARRRFFVVQQDPPKPNGKEQQADKDRKKQGLLPAVPGTEQEEPSALLSGGRAVHGASPSLILGSRRRSRRSAAVFPTKTNRVLKSTIPSSRGTSPRNPASMVTRPSPGYENTCSARTAPPNNSFKEANCRVIAGRAALRSPCRQSRTNPFSPRARANRTYSLPSTSIIFCRVCRATAEMPTRPRVRAGKIMWRRRSDQVTSSRGTAMGTLNPTGRQPRHTEKIIKSRIPTQEEGGHTSVLPYPLIRRSIHVSLFTAAMTPAANPI